MKCRPCNRNYPAPELLDGTAYFICPECGNVRVEKNYRSYTNLQSIQSFKENFGLELPVNYGEWANAEQSWVVKLPVSDNYYFSDEFYTLGEQMVLDPHDSRSIHRHRFAAKEWGVAETYVPIEGDGHVWLLLDYTDGSSDPKVVVMETDEFTCLTVAKSFNEFRNSLLLYDQVYNEEGEIIFPNSVS